MELQQINFKDQTIGFSVSGKGTPIVFLHGFCEDAKMWEEFVSPLKDVSVICIDLPGFGFSPLAHKHRIADMADGVKAVVDELAIDQFILVGHSMGGYVSLAFAKKYEARLLGLCLFHSHPFADPPEKQKHRNKSIEFVRNNGPIHYVKQVVPSLFGPSFSNRHLINTLVFQASLTSGEGMINALEAMRDRPDRSDVLKQCACPVQFIIGLKDPAVSVSDSMEQTHLPTIADIRVMENIGHMGMHSAADKTASYIKAFIHFCLHVQQPSPIS